MSGSSWVRRRSSTGVRSEPPPNHALVVTTKRVFICTAGTFGLRICAISEIPDAQNRGSSAAPGICARNSGANSPCTVEQCTPTFSNSRPCIMRHHAAASGLAGMVGAVPGRARETSGIAGIERGRRFVFELLECLANVVAQALEPGLCARLAIFDHGHVHLLHLTLCHGCGTSLPQRLAQRHRGSHGDIQRTQAGPDRNRQPGVGGGCNGVGYACGFPPEQQDVGRAVAVIKIGARALGREQDQPVADRRCAIARILTRNRGA